MMLDVRKKGLLARGGRKPLSWATRRRRSEGSWTRGQALRRGVGLRACGFAIGEMSRHSQGGGCAMDHIWQGGSGRVTKVSITYCPTSLLGPSPQGGGPLPPGASASGDGGQHLQDGAAHADGGHGGRMTVIGVADGGANGARGGRSMDNTWHRASGRGKGSAVQRRHGRRLRRGRSADRSQAGWAHDRMIARRGGVAAPRQQPPRASPAHARGAKAPPPPWLGPPPPRS
jgi:hypothetical protein